MPFQFTCPHCFKKTVVEDKYSGQTGPCASCGKTVTLPELDNRSRPSAQSTRTVFVAEHLKPALGEQSSDDSENVQVGIRGDSPANSAADIAPKRAKPITTTPAEKLRSKRIWIAGTVIVASFLVLQTVIMGYRFVRDTPVIQNLQDRRNHMMSLNNIGKIARALNAYAAVYGTYPPPVVYDENGKPKHSWRVLILPQLGEHSLYNQYKFDEPWDSQYNSLLFTQCPAFYRSPSVPSTATTSEANYFLLTGPGTVFLNTPGQPSPAPRDIGDGQDSTFLVVECANLILPWTQPVDYAASGTGQIKFGGCYADGTAVGKADGTPIWVPLNTPSEIMKAFTSPNGGEEGIDSNYFAK